MRRTVRHYLDDLTDGIRLGEQDGIRTLVEFNTIWREVVFYLIKKGEVKMTDDEQVVRDYIDTYTISALYRVAEFHRKQSGRPPLRYRDPKYHHRANTWQEYRRGRT